MQERNSLFLAPLVSRPEMAHDLESHAASWQGNAGGYDLALFFLSLGVFFSSTLTSDMNYVGFGCFKVKQPNWVLLIRLCNTTSAGGRENHKKKKKREKSKHQQHPFVGEKKDSAHHVVDVSQFTVNTLSFHPNHQQEWVRKWKWFCNTRTGRRSIQYQDQQDLSDVKNVKKREKGRREGKKRRRKGVTQEVTEGESESEANRERYSCWFKYTTTVIYIPCGLKSR